MPHFLIKKRKILFSWTIEKHCLVWQKAIVVKIELANWSTWLEYRLLCYILYSLDKWANLSLAQELQYKGTPIGIDVSYSNEY